MITFPAPAGRKEISRGVSEANPRVEEEQRFAPRQGLQELPAPLPGRIGLLQYPGVRFAHPRLISQRPSRAPGLIAARKVRTWPRITFLMLPSAPCTRTGGSQL